MMKPSRLKLTAVSIRKVTIHTDRKSTRLNSSHSQISYAVFCLKKKKKNHVQTATGLENVCHCLMSAVCGTPQILVRHLMYSTVFLLRWRFLHHVPRISD